MEHYLRTPPTRVSAISHIMRRGIATFKTHYLPASSERVRLKGPIWSQKYAHGNMSSKKQENKHQT